MSPADLVAVATVSTTLDVLTDFTGDRAKVAASAGAARATPTAPRRRRPTRPPRRPTKRPPRRPRRPPRTTSEMDMFNNDVRLRALKTLAETLAPIEQKKAILYFSAGMQRSGQDNQVELRAAINAAVRAHVVDLSGRHARAAGGRARRRRAPGERPRPGAVLGPRRRAAVRAARGVAGHADVARRRHRRPRLHRHQRLRRGVRARAARHVRLLPARLQQHATPPRTAASAGSRCA